MIVHMPSLTTLLDATLQTIATKFNQPITVFITPCETNVSDPSDGTAKFGIRWFGPLREARFALALRERHVRGRSSGIPKRERLGGTHSAIRLEARTGKVPSCASGGGRLRRG